MILKMYLIFTNTTPRASAESYKTVFMAFSDIFRAKVIRIEG